MSVPIRARETRARTRTDTDTDAFGWIYEATHEMTNEMTITTFVKVVSATADAVSAGRPPCGTPLRTKQNARYKEGTRRSYMAFR